MTPQIREKTAKTAVFRQRWQAWKVVRSIAAVRQRPRTPRNWRCSFAFFESFLWHFNKKQHAEVIFRLSRPVLYKNQENGSGKQWSLHAPLNWTNLWRKKLGSPAILRLFFQKTAFSYTNTYKNRHAIWPTFWRWTAKKFIPRVPETVWKRFQQKKIGMFMFKNQNDGAAFRPAVGDPKVDRQQKHFLTVCVSRGELGPSETHEKLLVKRLCGSSNEKHGEKLLLSWCHGAARAAAQRTG